MTNFSFAKTGCHSKLRYDELELILDKSSSRHLSKNWSDSTTIDDHLCFSIDTVGFVSLDDVAFSITSSLTHCTADITCNGGQVKTIGMSLVLNREVFTTERITSAIEATSQYCRQNGVTLGKCHTVMGDENWITVVSIGDTGSNELIPNQADKFAVIATKRFGALRAYLLENLLHQQNSAIPDTIASMTLNHSILNASFGKLPFIGSDVSGFGLAGSLFLLSEKHRLRIEINVLDIRYFGSEFGDMPISCATNHNRESFQSKLHFETSLSDNLDIAIFSPEYSGPVILLVEHTKCEEVLSKLGDNGFDAFAIGTALSSSNPLVSFR